MLKFIGVPTPPLAIEWDGQAYRFLRVVEHRTKLGSIALLLEWETNCRTCGAPFQLTTATAFGPTRNCEAHRRTKRQEGGDE